MSVSDMMKQFAESRRDDIKNRFPAKYEGLEPIFRDDRALEKVSLQDLIQHKIDETLRTRDTSHSTADEISNIKREAEDTIDDTDKPSVIVNETVEESVEKPTSEEISTPAILRKRRQYFGIF